MTDRSSARLSGALIVAVAAIAFSGKAIIIKLAYRYGVDAVTLLAFRMLFSAPLFVALAWWDARREKREPLSRHDLWAVMALGFIGYYLASYFDFLGLQYVTAALERLLLFIHPTFVLILAAVIFKRRITLRDVVAVALSYVGIAFVFGHDLATQPGNVALGASWVLLSALFYAAYLLGSGRIVGRVGSIRFACYAGIVSCVAVLVHFAVVRDVRLLVGQPLAVYNLSILMAAVSTVLPIVLTSEGIRRIGASHASIVASVGPVATIFLGAVFLDEAVTWVQVTGAALVLAGILAISMKKK
ncbi:MAG TPA: DMT family transporter [Usitatibacter sp.]|nr:DMT family transporter [Usitatibacter sp.]